MTFVRSSPSGKLYDIESPLEDYGGQAAWFIDPATGSDANPGSAEFPLRTMAELNDRLSGNVIRQATTVQLVGDVTDQPLMLIGTRFLSGASITVSGTVTTVSTALLTVVTALQANCTFQLTTSGIVWTSADVGKRIQLPGGEVGWVQEFVDANNVIIGPFSSTTGAVTPVASTAISIQTVSAALAPFLSLLSTVFTAIVTLQHLAFPAGGLSNAGAVLAFFGCRFNPSSNQYNALTNTNFRACCFQGTGALTLTGQGITLAAHTFIGGSILVVGVALITFTVTSFQACALSITRMAFASNGGAMHFRNTANPIVLQLGGHMVNNNFALSGSSGNTGFGINVRAGCCFTYLVAGTKPTVTGASGDTKIGLTNRTYAEIPYTDLQANAAPNTVTLLTGTTASMVLEN